MAEGWTVATLKEHFDALRKDDQQAIKVLADNFEKRMANTNEWRNTVESQQRTFPDKESVERRLKTLENAQLAAASKAIGAGQLWAVAAGIVFAVGSIMAIIFQLAPGGAQ